MEGRAQSLRAHTCQHTGRVVGRGLHTGTRRERLGRISISCSGKGFARQGKGKQSPEQKGRQAQLQTTEMLATLLQAPEPSKVAAENVESLSEEFFTVSSAYLELARKEGNTEVFSKLETVLKIAMEEKQKTLRPEIQLLNKLLATDVSQERKQILNSRSSGDTLVMNDQYFFSLLATMLVDVTAQRDSAQKASLLEKLKGIEKECNARVS